MSPFRSEIRFPDVKQPGETPSSDGDCEDKSSSVRRRWAEVASLFDSVIDAEAAERARILDGLTPEDPVRVEVERLIAEEAVAGEFLEDAPEFLSQAIEAAMADAFRPGDRAANRFRVVRFIARGGMGEI